MTWTTDTEMERASYSVALLFTSMKDSIFFLHPLPVTSKSLPPTSRELFLSFTPLKSYKTLNAGQFTFSCTRLTHFQKLRTGTINCLFNSEKRRSQTFLNKSQAIKTVKANSQQKETLEMKCSDQVWYKLDEYP